MWWFCDSVRIVLEVTDGRNSSRLSSASAGVIMRKPKSGSIAKPRESDRRRAGKEYERGGVGERG